MGTPTIYPTGATLFDPDKCWNGYTLFIARETGPALVDMNGNVVHLWKGLHGFPTKLLPGGQVMASLGVRSPKYGFMDHTDVVQVDWDGNVVWKFDQYEYIEDPGQEGMWMARQHHDYQREGNPVGYYAPGLDPKVEGGNTLILGHKDVTDPRISDKPLLDDVIYEVNWDGDIIWEWVCSEHFDEMDFSEAAKNAMARNPTMVVGGGQIGDWMHMNSVSTLGPNIDGLMKAISVFIRTTSSGTDVKPTSSPLPTRKAAKLYGRSVQIMIGTRRSGRWGGLSVNIMPT